MAGIGENIAALRKGMGITQEELGKALGVSMQAVSRWENGGTPDTMLLPALADYFKVSIDELFGREGSTVPVENALLKYLNSVPQDERIMACFRLTWLMQKGISNDQEFHGWDEFDRYLALDRINSRMDFSSGITEMRAGSDNWYFISPEPEGGRYDRLYNKEAHTKLFKLLSQPDAYDAFMLIFTRHADPYTAKLLVKRLNITEERAVELLGAFEELRFLRASKLELDDEQITIYNTSSNCPYIVMLLAAAQQVADPPSGFVYNGCFRDIAYLNKK